MKDFYHTKKWSRMRKAILARDGYIDQVAYRFGKVTEANTVHHIFPREDYPEYQWDAWNMVAVSAETHDSLHDRNTRQLTEEGMRLMIRTARKMGIEYDR